VDRTTLSELVAAGATLAEIARRTGVHPSTARRWLRRYGLATDRMAAQAAARDGRARGAQTLVRACPRHGAVAHHRDARGSYRCPVCNGERVSRRRRAVKAALVELAGGRCVLCGYARCARALSFHHVDPATKEFGVALRGVSRSLQRAAAEAAKCVLLCANCHMEVEAGLAQVPDTLRGHGAG
jgi:transposase-like protein